MTAPASWLTLCAPAARAWPSSTPLHNAAARPSPSTFPTPGRSASSDCCDGRPAPHLEHSCHDSLAHVHIYIYRYIYNIYTAYIFIYIVSLPHSSFRAKLTPAPSLLLFSQESLERLGGPGGCREGRGLWLLEFWHSFHLGPLQQRAYGSFSPRADRVPWLSDRVYPCCLFGAQSAEAPGKPLGVWGSAERKPGHPSQARSCSLAGTDSP